MSSISMTGTLNPLEEAGFTGAKRKRFSWHFNTPGRRRWLVVQFVTIPDQIAQAVRAEREYRRLQRQANRTPQDIFTLLDQYRDSQLLKCRI